MPTFLLGAGASYEAGLPLADDLTDTVISSVRHEHRPVLEFVKHAIQMQLAARAAGKPHTDYRLTIDSESLFNAVSDLVNRDTLDVAPFVLNWHPLLSTLNPSIDELDVERAIERVLKFDSFNSHRIRELAQLLVRVPSPSNMPSTILTEMEDAVVQSVKLKSDSSIAYLSPLAQIAQSSRSPVVIATLNYDLTVEAVLDQNRVTWSDGVFGSTPPQTRPQLSFGASDVAIYKLHGSVTWQTGPGGNITRQDSDTESNPISSWNGPRAKIRFGGRNKLTAEWPFLELFWNWREALENENTLVIIGYSFRDEHVNAVIASWLGIDDQRKLVIVDPGFERHKRGHPLLEFLRNDSTDAPRHWVPDPNMSSGYRLNDGPPPDPKVIIIRKGAGEALQALSSQYS